MFPEGLYVRACVSPEQTLLARYLGFDQTFTTNRLQGKDECIKFGDQKVKGQGHGGVKYAPKCTFGLVLVTCWQRHNG